MDERRIQRWNAAGRRLAEKERKAAAGKWDIIVIPAMPGYLRHPDGGAAVTRPMLLDEKGGEVRSAWDALVEARLLGIN